MTVANSTYYKRKNAHLCVYCGATLPDEYDRISCPTCIRNHAERTRELRKERRENNLCIQCGAIMRIDNGGTLSCDACRLKTRAKYDIHKEYIRDYNRKRHAERKAKGLCVSCNEPAIPGMTRCEKHRLAAIVREKKRRRFKPV